MNKIRVLPEILANKIAAGEIIERPASVVKELLENSIDAGAHSVSVVIESGGKKLITVRDDGEGMSQDDAILAFEHHATSKIQSVDDLAAIATLGFRGEALPSIASISRLTLRTRRAEDTAAAAGTELEIQGGVLRVVKAIAWDRGTDVTVRDLFFNVPARRKFLRSHETELSHITRLLTHYALAHPEMRYTLESDARMLLDVTPVPQLRDRVYQVFGEDFLSNLVEISGQADDVKVTGLCSRPHEQRTNPYSQFFYINRRMVRDRVISSAIRQAYQHCIPASAFPVVLIFLDIPFDQVDVNAHPAKTEVRFRQQGLVHDLVRNSIQQALTGSSYVPAFAHKPNPWQHTGMNPSPISPVPATTPPDSGGFALTVQPAAQETMQRAFNYSFRPSPAVPAPHAENHQSLGLRADLLFDSAAESQIGLSPGQLHILGQIHDSYIVASDVQGLIIIDQHVAHERILYEKFVQTMRRDVPETQGLLLPLTLELQPHQAALLREILPDLQKNGFSVEEFGNNSVLVRSVPAIVSDDDITRLLTEILEGLESEERTLDVARIRERIAVTMACRNAIKIHTPLSMEKMQWLLEELSHTKIPTNCPHGRPIILRFSLYEIERNFGRV